MIFLHTEKEPVHDYVRQAPFSAVGAPAVRSPQTANVGAPTWGARFCLVARKFSYSGRARHVRAPTKDRCALRPATGDRPIKTYVCNRTGLML